MKEENIISDIDAEEVQDRLLLSTVQKIKKLSPIPGKDRVEKVEFESIGFTAIVEKGLHEEGDLVVFTKYDSVVANIPPFEWMADFKFRVKPKSFTIKDDDGTVVGKIYSQGIVVTFKSIIDYLLNQREVSTESFQWDLEHGGIPLEGYDLTELLGTRKYIPQVTGSSSSFGTMKSKGSFPTHIVEKTDEDNLASKIKYLEYFKGKKCVARLKMEGSSLTMYVDPATEEFNVCSRNNIIEEAEGNKFWEAAKGRHLNDKMKHFKFLAIQSELMGPGVQKNKLGLTQPEFFVFTMTNINTKERFDDAQLVQTCRVLNIPIAPLVDSWEEFNLTFDELQEIADKLEYVPGVPAEGMVLRTFVPEKDGKGNWLSVKIINRNYSL